METRRKSADVLRRESLQLPSPKLPDGELRRTASLRIPRVTGPPEVDTRYLYAAPRLRRPKTNDKCNEQATSQPAGQAAPVPVTAVDADAPAPEYLARNLLQLGCPAVSMPRPRAAVRSDQFPSSDSDDSTTSHGNPSSSRRGIVHAQGQIQVDGVALPTVHISGPSPNPMDPASILNGSAGSIGARSAPSTPLQGVVGPSQTGQPAISGSQLTVASTNQPQTPKSPSHSALKSNDSQLSKPLSRSTPSVVAGSSIQTIATVSKTSTGSSPTSTSSARQKKFHRHFTQSSKFCNQVSPDERVINYYSCALVGDILLQGHLYITPNYFAFYSNVFGYVTKLLIPTASVLKISKEKTARIIPNAVAIATEDDRHVFCSLLSRDSTFKLMKEVWDAAMEPRPAEEALPIVSDSKLLTPEPLLVDDSEVNHEEDDSSMSESGTDLNSRPPTVCTDTDGPSNSIPITSIPRLEPPPVVASSIGQNVQNKRSSLRALLNFGLTPGTVIAILVGLLAVLYISAALMMVRIDRLHTAYLNHPLASPERFTQDKLLHYLNTNLDQIVKVRQSLQTLSQQFLTSSQVGSQGTSHPSVTGSPVEPEDAPS